MASFIIGNENEQTTIHFIDGDKAVSEFSKIDDFVSNMSKFDLQARLNCSQNVDTNQYIDFITKQIVPWNQQYIKIITEIIENLFKISANILKLCNLPKDILMILTNGEDEAGAAYCRGKNIIVLPITKLQNNEKSMSDFASGNEWETTIPHEIFHIISRNNLNLRDKLYECIGYFAIPDSKVVELPIDLVNLKITNPDAPVTKHYIKLCTMDSPDKELFLAPVLVSSGEYNADEGMSFFDYLLTRFAVLDETTWKVKRMIPYSEVFGLFDKIGTNTKYIIHPEEILADNFVLLLHKRSDVSSPNILNKMSEIIFQ